MRLMIRRRTLACAMVFGFLSLVRADTGAAGAGPPNPSGAMHALCNPEAQDIALFPGDLDPTFSDDGKQTADFPGGEGASDVAVQADGKIVAVGAAGGAFAITRHNADGTLDTGFSDDGKQTTWFADDAEANAVVIQPDGKIVVVGFTASYDGDALGPADVALARYNADGTLDTSFSDDGKQITDFGGNEYCLCFDVALQPDGKIVVAGISDWDFALARYNADGTLDTSFSGDGMQTTDFGGADYAEGVALQPDGKIVAAGYASGNFALARYNSDGSLDATFSGDGKQITGFGADARAAGVVLQSDGKIVAAGTSYIFQGSTTTSAFALARYNPDGSLDATFASGGLQLTQFGGGAWVCGVAIQSDGQIVVVGTAGGDFALARYNLDGSLDATFSGDGIQTTDFGAGDVAFGVALQADGKIIVVGQTGDGGDNVVGGGFALARYEGG